MRRKALSVSTAAVLVLAWPCQAAENLGKETGERLLARCEPALELIIAGGATSLGRERYAQAMSCIGFVEGFLWGHGWAAWRQKRDMYYCPPDAVSAQQAVPELVGYLRAHPERLDAAAHVLLFAAFSNAWPCTPMPEH